MLSHRTGFPEHTYAFGGLYPCDEGEGCETGVRDGTVMDLIRSLKDLDLSAELRERFQYSSAMYVVASAVVERLTGEWLGSYLKKELWEKLGMRSTVSEQVSLAVSLRMICLWIKRMTINTSPMVATILYRVLTGKRYIFSLTF